MTSHTIKSAAFFGTILAALALLTAAAYFLSAKPAQANPTGFSPTAGSSAATTTPTFLTPAAPTSTPVVYDAYGVNGTNEASTGSTQAADSIVLLLQFAGSSTASTLNTIVQYSQDGKDWYAMSLGSNLDALTASSSPSLGAVAVASTLPFASSTLEGQAPATGVLNATSTTRMLILKTPTRYIRATSYLPSGSLGGAVWQQFVPKKQNK